jgi:hypothetical protein
MDRTGVWWRIVHLEPALWRGVVMAVVALLAASGIVVSPAIPDTTVLLLVAVVAIVQAVWTRPAVVPNAKVVVLAPDPIADPATVQPGEAVTRASNADVLDAAYDVPRG